MLDLQGIWEKRDQIPHGLAQTKNVGTDKMTTEKGNDSENAENLDPNRITCRHCGRKCVILQGNADSKDTREFALGRNWSQLDVSCHGSHGPWLNNFSPKCRRMSCHGPHG